ncbi:hypothetical protein F5144DRAFT_595716 [Chaetomium tenue]|uniref:Uncharacterized protein n=1 Tax=Chaetomium tenue TaxID=1854479 RepID=A0ACB7NZG2_9PEZI|nr:hypothetical protein F5144DRAFT_595716 [Chaetomium globosum]
MERFDCVVVGAGWYGLGAAKQYHVTHPTDSLVVFDGQSTLGGSWASERIYPLLKSNNLLGTLEYPDFPMTTARFGIKTDNYIPGEVVYEYLQAYATEFGIDKHIRSGTRVLSAEHLDGTEGGWLLTTASSDTSGKQKQKLVKARRLIIATGITSEAFLPHFRGQETFGGRIFHGKDFQQNRDTLDTAKSAVVFGGHKFAWDAAYAYASAGVETHMVIRASGHGPCWMSPSYVTPFKKWIEKLANIRALTWFSPCIWGNVDGYGGIRNFLHGTALGRKIVDVFWSVLGGDVLALNKYDSHPETAKLKPWLPAMYSGTSFSILNYDTDFFQLVKDGKIRVHVGDITHLSPGKVHLSDGVQLRADVLLANTGWKHVPPVRFLPEGIDRELGLPHAADADPSPSADDLACQPDLLAQTDAQILATFPRLRDEPVWNARYKPLPGTNLPTTADDNLDRNPNASLTPFMLHRFMVPPSARFLRTRDIAFVGSVANFSNVITAHVQGLWVAAYFEGRTHRKDGVFAELFSPYGPEDYRRINEEWAAASA